MLNSRSEQDCLSSIRTTALILAGGAGQRFDNLDKGLQAYQGRPLIEHVIDIVQPQVGNVLLSVNRNLEVYQRYDFDLVTDEEEHFQGPMAGICSAIKTLTSVSSETNTSDFTEALLVTTCDSPVLPSDYVVTLIADLNTTKQSVAVVHDGVRRQNLHCLIKRDAWDSLTDFYRHGHRAMHRWFDRIGVSEVDFSAQADHFKNINSPDQLL